MEINIGLISPINLLEKTQIKTSCGFLTAAKFGDKFILVTPIWESLTINLLPEEEYLSLMEKCIDYELFHLLYPNLIYSNQN